MPIALPLRINGFVLHWRAERIILVSRRFRTPARLRNTLWFARDHSGCEREPRCFVRTPDISLENSQSLGSTAGRQLTEVSRSHLGFSGANRRRRTGILPFTTASGQESVRSPPTYLAEVGLLGGLALEVFQGAAFTEALVLAVAEDEQGSLRGRALSRLIHFVPSGCNGVASAVAHAYGVT